MLGLFLVTNIAPYFTKAAQDVYLATGDAAVHIPEGFQGGALDFAKQVLWAGLSSRACENLKWIGAGILVVIIPWV